MPGDDKKRRTRGPSRLPDERPKADKILSELTRTNPPAPTAQVAPPNRRYRSKCPVCKDVGRVRAPRESGVTRPCSVCGAGFEPDPDHAERIIDSMIKRRPRWALPPRHADPL